MPNVMVTNTSPPPLLAAATAQKFWPRAWKGGEMGCESGAAAGGELMMTLLLLLLLLIFVVLRMI